MKKQKHYDPKTFSYGFEIEWGDIDRSVKIPPKLGSWEYSEIDILNLRKPYKYIAADPKGINPPVGGEINTYPTIGWEGQIKIISKLKKLFKKHGTPPTVCSTTHSHVHVHIPGMTSDIDALKRLARYIQQNQELTIAKIGGFKEHPEMKDHRNSKAYLKSDGGRLIPEYILENIETMATDLSTFVNLQRSGKKGLINGKATWRPFRWGINIYNLNHMETIEFRFFRASTNIMEIASCFSFVELFMDAALNTGKPVKEILEEYDFEFPKFQWNEQEWIALKKTQYEKDEKQKVRSFIELENSKGIKRPKIEETRLNVEIKKITSKQFIKEITDNPLDRFAKTFKAKAKAFNLWDNCYGYFLEGQLMGAVIYKISKREPYCMNFELLHVFAKHRRKGVATLTYPLPPKKLSSISSLYHSIISSISFVVKSNRLLSSSTISPTYSSKDNLLLLTSDIFKFSLNSSNVVIIFLLFFIIDLLFYI